MRTEAEIQAKIDELPHELSPDLYSEPEFTVSGYIQRRANALRHDLGLPERDYNEGWQRNRFVFLVEARLVEFFVNTPPLSAFVE